MAASSIFTKDPLIHSKFFFFCYALGQISLEVLVLIGIASLLKRFKHPFLFYTFIGATFMLFILHIFDMILDRVLDLSVWSAISLFVIHETLGNFLYLLDATGVPLWGWAIFFALFAGLPFLGIFFYRITEKIIKKKPLSIRLEYPILAFLCIPTALLFWDFSGSRVIHPNTYTALIQSLPWKSTFLQPENIWIEIPSSAQLLPQEKQISDEIAKNQTTFKQPQKKPNIYLFVVESFRKDAISEASSPNLFEFQKLCAPSESTFANGNASHLSWFSIFHSQFSYYWQLLQKGGWTMGSPPLTLLKKLGYQVHLYSSAQLEYYGMEKLLFGAENSILNSNQRFHHAPPVSAADTDAKAIETLLSDLEKNPALQEGQIFIIFWDATHFDYSWPKGWTPKFTPFATELAYFSALYSKNQIPLIKNRYKNAVHYIDHLFGNFLANIPNKDEAIIVVTGDHGEEFCEHGHLFHGSHLMQEQINIPILMKFGKNSLPTMRNTISQMDIFPSIFDYIYGETPSFLQGQSVFRDPTWKFTVTSRFNAGRSPYEFSIFNGKYKLIARFSNQNEIEQSQGVQIISLQDLFDQNLVESQKNLHTWIHQEFGEAWTHLFNGSPNLPITEGSPQTLSSDQ